MQCIAIGELAENVTMEQLRPHFQQEITDTIGLYLKDVIRNFYTRVDEPGVVFMMECKSAEEARKHLGDLIFVKEQLIEFQLIVLEPLKPLGLLIGVDL